MKIKEFNIFVVDTSVMKKSNISNDYNRGALVEFCRDDRYVRIYFNYSV
jgi:hypothetical protein